MNPRPCSRVDWVSAVLRWPAAGLEQQDWAPHQRPGTGSRPLPLLLLLGRFRERWRWRRRRREEPSQDVPAEEEDLPQKSVCPSPCRSRPVPPSWAKLPTLLLSSAGVSWFVSAEELRSEARKENRPAGGPTGGRSSAWFQPYGSVAPWREPLRQRQVPEDRSSSNSSRRHYHRSGDKTTPPAGAPVSLQVGSLLPLDRHLPQISISNILTRLIWPIIIIIYK